MRSIWRGGRASGAPAGFVNAVLRTISRQRDVAAASAAARAIRTIARPRSTTSASPCRIRAGWRRAGTTGSGSTPPRPGCTFNNAPAPGDASREPPAGHAARSSPTGSPPKRCVVRPAGSHRTASSSKRGIRCAGAGLDEGWFVVQDEASQLVALLAGEHPGRRVLDTCASPGGKTTALAAAMDEARPARRLRRRAIAASSCCDGPSRRAARPTSASCRRTS